MFDGLFKKSGQGQQAASSAAKSPVAPRELVTHFAPAVQGSSVQAGPLEVSRDTAVGADFQSVVDEAAIVFAGGEEKAAADMLIDFLKQTNGKADRRVWFMLLDIYQALAQKDQYEKLSLMFANKFGTSPPSWEEALGSDQARGVQPGAGAAGPGAVASGRNVLIIDGPAADGVGGRAKDFVAASREMKNCKLDISRMKMEQSTLEGFTALQSIMGQLRKHRVSATLMGENHVASWLDKKVKGAKETQNPNDSPYWMLLLEILQWRGLMEEFEELSLEYTITYEISGPGWEPTGVMTIEAVAEVEEEAAANAIPGRIVPENLITDMSVQRLQEEIQQAIAATGEAQLDFRPVRRMDFSAAGTFLNMLLSLGEEKAKKVVIVNPSELILALGEVLGFSQHVTIVPRKR